MLSLLGRSSRYILTDDFRFLNSFDFLSVTFSLTKTSASTNFSCGRSELLFRSSVRAILTPCSFIRKRWTCLADSTLIKKTVAITSLQAKSVASLRRTNLDYNSSVRTFVVRISKTLGNISGWPITGPKPLKSSAPPLFVWRILGTWEFWK